MLALGRNFGFADRFDEAEQVFRRYLATNPPAPLRASGTFYVAAVTKRRGEAEKADELLAEAKRIDPHVWMTMMEPPRVIFDAP
jgi:tetratricopeptide (TPR) repeat protein